MEQLLEFLVNHWILTLALVAIVGGLVATFVVGEAQGVKKVTPVEAIRLINHEDAIVVDIRAEGEYRQGHILNSVHVPFNDLNDRIKKLDSHRERPVIMVCRTGQRSPGAGARLRKHGFEHVYTLKGGLAAWEQANLPVVKK